MGDMGGALAGETERVTSAHELGGNCICNASIKFTEHKAGPQANLWGDGELALEAKCHY